jgi:uracil-DNA glycosylase family 4
MDEQEEAAIRRAVIQRLQDFGRSGLTHWKRIEPIVSSNPPVTSPQVRPAPTVMTSPPRSTGQSPERLAQTAAHESPAIPAATPIKAPPPIVAAAPVLPNPVTFQPLDLPRDERIARLNVLCDQVKACVRCQELAGTRTQTVFGVGNPEARILFVGEAPGADEDKQGEPFVGRAGQLLNDIIKACRLKREDIYICNVLRCRPPGNRLPSETEAANCREYLDGQIAIVNPQYIVCWGSTAAKNLLATESPIGKMRGKFFQYGRAKVICTYHPSYLLRNPAAKKDVWEDMKFLFLDMGIDLTAKS